MASVQELYSGIIKPGGGMFEGTGGAGVYDGILPGATGAAPSSDLITRSVKTLKIDPYTGMPVTGGTPVTSQFMTAEEKALLERQIVQSKALQAGYDPNGQPRAVTLAGMYGRGQPVPQPNIPTAYAEVPLPRVRPAAAPWSPELTAALSPGATTDDLLGYAQSAPSGPITPAAAATEEMAGGLPAMFAPSAKPAGPTGVGTNGYTYVDGKNVGYSAEEQARRDALGKAIGDANRKSANQTYSASGERNAFMPTSYQNSVRQQTGY